MNKQLITTFLFLLVGVYVFGQKDTSVLRNQSATECFSISKYDDEYIIRVGGIDYNDEEKVFICENELPLNVEVIYKSTGNAVNGSNWDWSDCECNPSNPISNTGTITLTPNNNFDGDDKLKIKIKFDDLQTPELKIIEIKLNVIKGLYVKYSEHSEAQYIFDNGDKLYPVNTAPSINNKPIKYIQSGKYDYIKAEAKPNKSFSSISLSSSEDKASFDPSYFNNEEIKLKIDVSEISGRGFININSCDHDLNIFHKDLQSEEIRMYLMCESDDDQQRNLGEVMSSEDICVSPGDDGTLDEYQLLELGLGTRWVDSRDEVKEINGIKHVVAGNITNSNGNFECFTKARTNNVDCPVLPENWNEIITEVKNFYFNQASYSLTFLPIETIKINYDSRVDNSIFTKSTESQDFINSYYNGQYPEKASFFIVEDAGGNDINTRGYGLNNFMVAEAYSSNTMSLIIAHELGHALFNLKHPEDYPNISEDDDCFMMAMPSEVNGDKLSKKTVRTQQLIQIKN